MSAVIAGRFMILVLWIVAGTSVRAEVFDSEVDAALWPEVRQLIEHSCLACHHAGGGAPFVFRTRSDLVMRSRQLSIVLERRLMPPLRAGPGLPRAAEDALALSDESRGLLLRWLEAGAPGAQGETDALDPEPAAARIARAGREPDLRLTLSTAYLVPAEGLSDLRTFVLPFDVDHDREVERVELIVSEPRVARHAFFSIDQTGTGRMLDEADPLPGYATAADVGLVHAGAFASWAMPFAGSSLPPGFARRLPATGDLLVQFDFHPIGRTVPFTFEVRLFYAGKERVSDAAERPRLLTAVAMGTLDIRIEPGRSEIVRRDELVLPVPAAVLEIVPHGGAICRSIRLTALPPDEAEALDLLDIPDWDWNWHRTRTLAAPVELPAGTRLSLEIRYDNTEANPRNPFQPPRLIELGHPPEGEPALVLLLLAPLEPHDAGPLEELHLKASLRRMRERTARLRGGQ